MTGRETPRDGAEKMLYEEKVTPRNSLAFNIGMVILGKIFKGIGKGIDKVTGWIPLPTYTNDGNEQTAPALASGYRMAMARKDTLPVVIGDDAAALDWYPTAERAYRNSIFRKTREGSYREICRCQSVYRGCTA